MNAPELTVVIGANGAGKTTWCREQRDSLPKPFYNADSIAEGLGDANDPGPEVAWGRGSAGVEESAND